MWPHLMLYTGNKDTGKGGTDLPLLSYLTMYLFFAPDFVRLICSSSGWDKTIWFKWHQIIGLDWIHINSLPRQITIKQSYKVTLFFSAFILFSFLKTAEEPQVTFIQWIMDPIPCILQNWKVYWDWLCSIVLMEQTSETGGCGSIICADVQVFIYIKLKWIDVTSEKGLLLLMP